MSLTPQRHLVSAALDSVELQYTWNDWNVHEHFRPGDEELADRVLGISHRARIALTIAIGEWIVYRFRRLVDVEHRLCSDYVEAMWAWNISWKYARPFRPIDREWQGPLLGPLELVIVIGNDAFERCEEQGATEHNPAWMSQLAEHVLPRSDAYREWLEGVMARLEAHFPWEYDPEDYFLEKDFRGRPVPREVFDLGQAFDPSRCDALLEGFLARLAGKPNPFTTMGASDEDDHE